MSSYAADQNTKEQKSLFEPLPLIEKNPNATILLVEDEDSVREATAEFLQSVGYRVLKARSSNEAIGLFCIHAIEINLLIADLMLPGQNGRKLVSYLKELHPEFKTLFISGYPEQMILRNLKTAAEHCFLAKPFTFRMLLETIAKVLASKQLIFD